MLGFRIMDLKSRRKVFYLLVLIFILLSPLLVIYSLGYSFDISSGRLNRLGGIFVKTETPGLSVYLNNSFQKKTSFLSGGALLTNLEPETYLLRLERDGYQTWSRTVKVDPGLVIELRNILLFPTDLNPVITPPEERSALALSQSPSYPYQIDNKNNLLEKTATAIKKLATDVKNFGVVGEKVLFVNGNGFLARLDPATGAIQTIGRPGFVMNKTAFKFIGSARGDVAVIDSAEGIYTLDTSDNLYPLKGGISQVSFDAKGDKMLLVSKNTLEVLWMADNTRQPFQDKGSKELVLKINSPILEAAWFYKNNAHIFIRTANGIFVTELDGRGGRNTTELVTGKTESLQTSPDFPNIVFFGRAKKLYKIEF